MNYSSQLVSLFIHGICLVVLSSASACAAVSSSDDSASSRTALRKFDQSLDRIENLQLPLNKVVLYRQASVALIDTDKPRAIALLKRALSDIDAAEASMKLQHAEDDRAFRQLEFHRLPVMMLMERIDPKEAINLLVPPQTADLDTAFQVLFFERLKDPELVRETAQRKLDYGVTPAVVAAYEVLCKQDPAYAMSLSTAIVLKLAKSDPSNDPAAVQSAFALLRLLRVDIGSRAPAMVFNPTLIGPDALHDLFVFIGDAFVSSKDPEMLILGEKPSLYIAALDTYAPIKAQDVKLLAFAAPNAKSLILSPEKPVVDVSHPDPATLTPDQIQARAATKAQVDAQMQETNTQMALLAGRIKDPSLTQKERDSAVFAAVEQANKAIAVARFAATALDREAFQNGELELYNLGIVTNVVDSASSILQAYAIDHPQVAEEAARTLDGHEVQTEVGLQVAIREMTGSPAYLVPPAKRAAGSFR